MKQDLLRLFILLLIFVGLLVYIDMRFVNGANEELKDEKAHAVNNMNIMQGQLAEARKYNKLLNALDRVGSQPYDEEDNNCYDHAQAMQAILADEYDIESSIMITEGRTHAWLVVWIEATTGHFISPDNPFNVLEVRDRELKVICN